MLASLADECSGAACSPAQPLDVSAFFSGARRPAVMLFLSCAYSGPEATPARLQTSLAHTGGLQDVAGMLALAHRLSADRLLHAALDWAHAQADEVYDADPTLWFRTAAELQLDCLRGRLAAWVVAQLRRSPAVAVDLLQVRRSWCCLVVPCLLPLPCVSLNLSCAPLPPRPSRRRG